MPDVFSVADKDILHDVSKGNIQFLIANKDRYVAASVKDKDVHVMNKYSIVRHYDKLMELAE